MKKLEKKVAIVTSSTKGIGLACAQTLASHGAIVYLAARNKDSATQIRKEIQTMGGIAKYVHFENRSLAMFL